MSTISVLCPSCIGDPEGSFIWDKDDDTCGLCDNAGRVEVDMADYDVEIASAIMLALGYDHPVLMGDVTDQSVLEIHTAVVFANKVGFYRALGGALGVNLDRSKDWPFEEGEYFYYWLFLLLTCIPDNVIEHLEYDDVNREPMPNFVDVVAAYRPSIRR